VPRKKTAPDLAHIAEDLRPLARALAELHEDPANARLHGERNLAAIQASLRRFGQRKPLVVRRATMTVEAGNGTLAAGRALGWSHLACVLVDDDPTTATGCAIADNRSAELAEWDDAALARLLASVEETHAPEELGFGVEEMKALVAAPAPDPLANVQPIGSDEVRRLDEKKLHACPHCGGTFTYEQLID